MLGMKNRLLLSILSLALIGATGCASMQASADPATAPASPQFSTPPPEVRASMQFTGVLVQIYHPETRTLYMWVGNPRPTAKGPMQCFKLQLSDTQSGTPQKEPCE
jgi:hypothetical protein